MEFLFPISCIFSLYGMILILFEMYARGGLSLNGTKLKHLKTPILSGFIGYC